MFKVFIEFVTILFLFYVLFFCLLSKWDLKLLNQGSNPHPSALESQVFTGLPGKFPLLTLKKKKKSSAQHAFSQSSLEHDGLFK